MDMDMDIRQECCAECCCCMCCTPPKRCRPIVITGNAMDITPNSATIANSAYSGICENINFVAIQYSTDPSMRFPTIVYGNTGLPFSLNLTGLQPGTTYFYRAMVSTENLSYCGRIRSFSTPSFIAVVTTGDATNILVNSATIVNNMYSGITEAINSVAVEYSTSPSMNLPITVYGTIGSPFSVNLTALESGITYYYRAVVNTVNGSYYGEIKSFSTLPIIAVVTTGDATNILETSATIINNTYSGIIGTINFVSIEYSTSPSMNLSTTVYGIVGSPFSVDLTTLEPGTTYYYRAVVSTSNGSYYGEIKSFSTLALIINVTTGDATAISPTTATIANNTYSGITGVINFVAVQYSTSPTMNPSSAVRGTTGSPFSVDLTALQPNTTYYYRAGINTPARTYFGAIKSFTTPSNP